MAGHATAGGQAVGAGGGRLRRVLPVAGSVHRAHHQHRRLPLRLGRPRPARRQFAVLACAARRRAGPAARPGAVPGPVAGRPLRRHRPPRVPRDRPPSRPSRPTTHARRINRPRGPDHLPACSPGVLRRDRLRHPVAGGHLRTPSRRRSARRRPDRAPRRRATPPQPRSSLGACCGVGHRSSLWKPAAPPMSTYSPPLFIVAAVVTATRRRPVVAGLLLGAAAAVKLLPLLLLPAFTAVRRRDLRTPLVAIGTFVAGYLPHLLAVRHPGARLPARLPGPGRLLRRQLPLGDPRATATSGGPPADRRPPRRRPGRTGVRCTDGEPIAVTCCWLYGAALLMTTPTYPWYGAAADRPGRAGRPARVDRRTAGLVPGLRQLRARNPAGPDPPHRRRHRRHRDHPASPPNPWEAV